MLLEPAAAVLLEEVAQDVAAGRLVGVGADETDALVGRCTARSVSTRLI